MNKLKSLLVVSGSIALLASLATPANATTASLSGGPETHCVALLPSDPKSTALPEEACAPTEEALIEVAQQELGIDLTEAREEAPSASEVSSRTDASIQQLWTLGRIYEHSNYGGSSYAFTVNNSNACGTTAIPLSALSAIGWNDRISSFKGNVCRATLYEHNSFAGATYGPSWGTTSLGSFNDRASSIRWVS